MSAYRVDSIETVKEKDSPNMYCNGKVAQPQSIIHYNYVLQLLWILYKVEGTLPFCIMNFDISIILQGLKVVTTNNMPTPAGC